MSGLFRVTGVVRASRRVTGVVRASGLVAPCGAPRG